MQLRLKIHIPVYKGYPRYPLYKQHLCFYIHIYRFPCDAGKGKARPYRINFVHCANGTIFVLYQIILRNNKDRIKLMMIYHLFPGTPDNQTAAFCLLQLLYFNKMVQKNSIILLRYMRKTFHREHCLCQCSRGRLAAAFQITHRLMVQQRIRMQMRFDWLNPPFFCI